MKKINVLGILKKSKDNILQEFKYHFFTKFVPAFLLSYGLYNVYKYKLYKFHKFIFTISEEKLISKKIYPILKFKNIENLYDEESREHEIVSMFYKILIKYLQLNLKDETFVIKSDLMFLNILSTGSLFISDSFYNLCNDCELFSFFIIHSLMHITHRHATTNISGIFSKVKYL